MEQAVWSEEEWHRPGQPSESLKMRDPRWRANLQKSEKSVRYPQRLKETDYALKNVQSIVKSYNQPEESLLKMIKN